jgi:outer membrane protein assembly factor BamB
VTAYDPQTGEKHWSYRVAGLANIPSPAAGEGLVLVPAGEMVALKPSRAKDTPDVLWKSSKLRSPAASALCYKGRVYAVNSANVLACADAADGKVLWQKRLEGFKGTAWASPVAGDGKLYVVSEGGLVAAVQLGGDSPEVTVNHLEEPILATPAIADGAVFLRSDAHLWCFGKAK